MTFKTSLFNKGLILSDIKRFSWVSGLYAGLLFFILPFKHMMRKNALDSEWIRHQIQNSLSFTSSNLTQVLLILVIPITLAVLIFRYLQKTNAAAMIHSLPYSRKTLYCSHSAAGLLLLCLPIIFIGFVLMILQATTVLGEYYSFLDILSWMNYTLLFNILFFSTTVFVGMFTGNSVAHEVFTYILHILPAGIYVLFRFNLSHLLYGYSRNELWEPALENLPIFRLLRREALAVREYVGYIAIIILFFTIAYYVYKIRNIETAGDIIAFTGVRPVFKYGVTLCSMLLGGLYFATISGGTFSIIAFGYLFSSFLGYWIAEIIMEKSFKVWTAYKGYVTYTILLLILLIGIHTDVTGYVGRIPKAEDVENVFFGSNIYRWEHFEEMQGANGPYYRDGIYYSDDYIFIDPESIKNIITLHQTLIDEPSTQGGTYRYIAYTLKNGKQLIRQYVVSDQQHTSSLKPIYESIDYKRIRFPIIEQSPEEIKWLEITDDRSPKKSFMLTDAEEIEEFVELFRMDIHRSTYEELMIASKHIPIVTIMTNDDTRMSYPIYKSYTSVYQWLKDKGIYEDVMLLPEDIDFVRLESFRESSSKSVEIRDLEVIEELIKLDTVMDYSYREESIFVNFFIKDFPTYSFYLNGLHQDVPISDELQSYLNQLKN
ncbi:ABC-2 type transport system permease protein [Anaerovirgula multivorans]|uniref:ABC-2 type transport system permease protein n=1 Tax=Anaerovirgula multivorans TaxID=312168 RepID=A0A239CVN9_9FIRM|nr:DUF6449 domain-containing protein [Anaerovirgula multivorans]SNS24160.1 ABC-2 type transport system permease protein [Anaerovirgula multivorans]